MTKLDFENMAKILRALVVDIPYNPILAKKIDREITGGSSPDYLMQLVRKLEKEAENWTSNR